MATYNTELFVSLDEAYEDALKELRFFEELSFGYLKVLEVLGWTDYIVMV